MKVNSIDALQDLFANGKADEIKVINAVFSNSVEMSVESLFNGYDFLKVVTYSIDTAFMERIIRLFKKVEIIIGTDNTLNQSLQKILDESRLQLEEIKKSSYLLQRLKDDSLSIHVLKTGTSHEKFYILKSDDGRGRVITGSANMTMRAWHSKQHEIYIVFDDEEALAHFEKIYDFDKGHATSSPEVFKACALSTGQKAEDAYPLIKEVAITRQATIIEVENCSERQENHVNIIEKDKLQKFTNKLLDKACIDSSSKDGRIVIIPDKINRINNVFKELKTEERILKTTKLPEFIVDIYSHSAIFNGVAFDLHPSVEELKASANIIFQFMDGYDNFEDRKYTPKSILKEQYYMLLNYMFLSPFVAEFRHLCTKYKFDSNRFPMFYFIQGPESTGKSSAVDMMTRLMFQEEIQSVKMKDYDKEMLKGMIATVKGIPIVVEEMTPRKWSSAPDVIKMDYDEYWKENHNHGCFIFLSNDVKNVENQLAKRMIFMNVENCIEQGLISKFKRKTELLKTNAKNAIYREYLRRMFDATEVLRERMKEEAAYVDSTFLPDLFYISSEILINIFKELGYEEIEGLHSFSFSDYNDNRVKNRMLINNIKDRFLECPKLFEIKRKSNRLIVQFSNDNQFDKDLMKQIMMSYETRAEIKPSSGKLVINRLDRFEELIGFKFRKSFWGLYNI